MKLRKFKEDSKMQKKFIQELLETEDIQMTFDCFSKDYAYLKKIEKNNHCYHNFYVKEEERYIGWISYCFENGKNVAEIEYCVHPSFRGWGYASKMVTYLERILYEHGVEKTKLEIPGHYDDSIRVAEKSGYEFYLDFESLEMGYVVFVKNLKQTYGEKGEEKTQKTFDFHP